MSGLRISECSARLGLRIDKQRMARMAVSNPHSAIRTPQ